MLRQATVRELAKWSGFRFRQLGRPMRLAFLRTELLRPEKKLLRPLNPEGQAASRYLRNPTASSTLVGQAEWRTAMRFFATTLILLFIALAIIMASGDLAEARRKRPSPATGECVCKCVANQNPQNFSTKTWTTTSDGCGSGLVGSSCVANAGTSNAMLGKWTHCDWTNTSAPSTSLKLPPGSPPKGEGGVTPPVSGGTKQQ
jgi:hypothetical protein